MAVARRFSATGADQASNDHIGDGALTSLHAISFARMGFQFEWFPHLRAGVLNHASQVYRSFAISATTDYKGEPNPG